MFLPLRTGSTSLNMFCNSMYPLYNLSLDPRMKTHPWSHPWPPYISTFLLKKETIKWELNRKHIKVSVWWKTKSESWGSDTPPMHYLGGLGFAAKDFKNNTFFSSRIREIGLFLHIKRRNLESTECIRQEQEICPGPGALSRSHSVLYLCTLLLH